MKLSQITIIEAAEIDYAGIDSDIVDRLSPFPSHLQQWAIKEINKGEHAPSVVDAIEYYQTFIKDNRFQQILAKLTPSPKNILTLSLSQIKDAQAENDEKYHRVSNRELKKVRKLNYTDKLVDTSRLKIVKITKKDETDGAAKILSDLARASKWCVTDVEKADEYLTEGSLYVIYLDDKKYLYAPENDQLMNVKNKPWRLSAKEYGLLSPHLPQIALYLKDKENHPDYVKAVMQSPRHAIDYALYVIHGRWPEGEPYIMKDPRWAFHYARSVIHGRWPEAEPYIMKDAIAAKSYAYCFINGRWLEAEPHIMKDPSGAADYAHYIIKGRWSEAEPTIMKDPSAAVNYAHYVIKGRWPEAEPKILKDPIAAIKYADDVIKDRWREAEPIIMKDPSAAIKYASSIIKGRWPEAEPYIMKSPEHASWYARVTIKGRWPEAEPYIIKDPMPAAFYADYVIKGRWREAEPIIMSDKSAAENYREMIRELNISLKN